MHFLESLLCCVILILFLSVSLTSGAIPLGYYNCFNINDKITYNATRISTETAKALLWGGQPKSTEKMPEAPREIFAEMADNIPVIKWTADPKPLYGLKYLRHILLKIVQTYSNNDGTFEETEYILLNVTGVRTTTRYSYNCSKLKPWAYEVSVTLWFIGKLRQSENGHLAADVDDYSRSKSHLITKHEIISEFKARKWETEGCICSSRITTLKVSRVLKESFVGVRAQIQAVGIPNDTFIEVQLIQDVDPNEQLLVERWNLLATQIQNSYPYIKTVNVSGGSGYFIRVKPLCKRKYAGILYCGKDVANTSRSNTIYIEKGSFNQQISSPIRDQGPYNLPLSSPIKDKGGADIYQILQLTAVTILFGICIVAEAALIIRILKAIFSPRKKSSSVFKRSTYVELDDKGKPTTKLTTVGRVAIIYTRDSRQYEERVEKINSKLQQSGIDSVLFDERSRPEMRVNWIESAENVTKNFEVILFVISPQLFNTCKKENTLLNSTEEERNKVDTNMLTRFPAVVLDTVKARYAWAGTNKAKLISVCIAETKQENKQLSMKMRKEHPLLFKDKIFFESLSHEDASSLKALIKYVQNVINSIK